LLTIPLEAIGIEDEAYYFVHPEGGASREVELFKEWIISQVTGKGGSAAAGVQACLA